MSFSKYKLVACEMGSNYQLKDGLVAFKSLFQSSNKDAENFSTSWFKEYFGLDKNQGIFFTDNGRTGLYLLLKSLNLPSQSEVLIQGFSCIVLPNSVWQAGLNPILCDINEKNYNFDIKKLEAKITTNTKVLVIQYTFGIVPNMQEVVDFCLKNNLYLIEDCAHSLGGSAEINGKTYKLGQIGHGAFFSFGRDKIISTTIGGLVVINPKPFTQKDSKLEALVDKKNHSKNLKDLKKETKPIQWNFIQYQNEVFKNYQNLPEMSGKRSLQALSYCVLAVFIIRPFYHFILGKVVLFLGRKYKIIADIYTNAEEKGTNSLETNSKYSPKLFPLLQNQLLKFETYSNHRRQIAMFYRANLPETITLADDDFKLLEKEKQGGYLESNFSSHIKNIYLRYPINLSKTEFYFDKYSKIKAELRKQGILIGTWYTSLFMQPKLDLEKKFNYKKGNLPIAEKLSDRAILNLPTNINTSLLDAERICGIIKEVLGVN